MLGFLSKLKRQMQPTLTMDPDENQPEINDGQSDEEYIRNLINISQRNSSAPMNEGSLMQPGGAVNTGKNYSDNPDLTENQPDYDYPTDYSDAATRLGKPGLAEPEQSEQDYPTDYSEQSEQFDQSNESDKYDDIREMAADTPSLDAYRKYISDAPQAEDYEASTGRKLLTGLVGMFGGQGDAAKGIKIQQELEHAPYERAMKRYKEQGAGMQHLTNAETNLRGKQGKILTDVEKLEQGDKNIKIKSDAEASKADDRSIDNKRADAQLKLNRAIAKINEDYKNGMIDLKGKDQKIKEAHNKATEATSRRNADTYARTAGGNADKPVPMGEQAKAQSSAVNMVIQEMPDSFDMTDPEKPKIKEGATEQEKRAIKSRIDALTSQFLNRKRSSPTPGSYPHSQSFDVMQDPGSFDVEDEDDEDEGYR